MIIGDLGSPIFLFLIEIVQTGGNMPFLFFILFLFGFLYLEISCLIWLSHWISFFGVLALLIGSALLGIRLIQLSGLASLFRFRQQLMQGQLPTQSLFKGIIAIVAGVLLIIPGVLTDFIALLLLFSPLNSMLELYLLNKVRGKISKVFSGFGNQGFQNFGSQEKGFQDQGFYHQSGFKPNDEQVFDAEFERENDENHRLK